MRPLVLALAVGLLAASASEAKPATINVAIEGMKFATAELTVHTGDTVMWTNRDIVAHTVTSKTGLFDSKLIPPGGTWKYVAKKAGTFSYACTFHPLMTAVLKVR